MLKHSFVPHALLLNALFAGLSLLPVLAVPEGYTPGTRLPGTAGVTETTAQLMERQSRSALHAHKVLPVLRGDFQNLPANPDSPVVANWPPTTNSTGPAPKTPQTTDVNFLGATLADTLSFPPDSMGAAGPSQFIVAVNGRIRSFNKVSGLADGVLNINTDPFFASVMTPPVTNNFTSDPRIRYDRLSGRWFIVMIDVPGQTGALPNRVLVAVSSSSVVTLSTVWTFFFFQADSTQFGDYPTLGIDANALYIGVNLFGSRGLRSSFGGTSGFVVQKSSILGAGPIVVTAFTGLAAKQGRTFVGPFTPQGVDNYDPTATEGYIIGVDAGFYGMVQLRRVSNPGSGSPSISGNITINIPLNGATINVPHQGNTGGANGDLDGGDYRLLAAHLRNGHLWATENIGVDNTGAPGNTRMGVRWYDFTGIPTGQTPTVNQSGTLYQPSASNTSDQRCYWMGTAMVSGQGHVAMGFSVAGANEFANAGTVGRLANDPLGTMRTPVLYTASSTSYNPAGDPGSSNGRRWGDFSYVSLDPADDMTMWTIQEFCNATDTYGVQVVRLLAPGPATPASCSPSTVTNGATGINVVLTGTTNGDTGFFDPGPGFSNRISAAVVGGGVTVNSLTYTDPTHLTLNLSVSGASTGAQRVSVTNPDGQTAISSTAILNIIGNTATNSPPALAAIPNHTINELTTLTFTNSATDPDGDSLTYSLDPGFPSGATVNSTNGVFTWTPSEAQGPSTNNITVRVTDNGTPPLSNTKSFTVIVNEVNSAPVLAPIADHTIHAESTLTLTNSATDSDIPTNTLTFSLTGTPPAGAAINSVSGVFTWTPSDTFVNTTNSITVRVTDNGSPPLNDSKTFNVIVVSRPTIESIIRTNGVSTLLWSSISGQTYRVEFKLNLDDANWSNLAPDVTATGSTATQNDTNAASVAHRLYRLQLVP